MYAWYFIKCWICYIYTSRSSCLAFWIFCTIINCIYGYLCNIFCIFLHLIFRKNIGYRIFLFLFIYNLWIIIWIYCWSRINFIFFFMNCCFFKRLSIRNSWTNKYIWIWYSLIYILLWNFLIYNYMPTSMSYYNYIDNLGFTRSIRFCFY